MHRNDPILRIATQLHRRLHHPTSAGDSVFLNGVGSLLARQSILTQLLRRITVAKRHGWHLAAERLKAQLPYEAQRVGTACDELLEVCAPQRRPPISLQNIVDELRQLHAEFEDVDLSQRGRILVISDSIELEGIALGRFAMELHLSRLGERLGSGCFDCVAQDPNPAANSDDVTHPHVQSNVICAGDASTPIANALKDGRICDAFTLVNSVLHTYNAGSPYVSLDNWSGVACGDCGYSTNRDDLYSCEGCGDNLCEECVSSCDLCGTSRCGGCLETDRVSEQRCCASCVRQCDACHRVVDRDSFNSDSGLCPGCLEEQQVAEATVESESITTPLTEEILHESVPTHNQTSNSDQALTTHRTVEEAQATSAA